MSRNNRLSRKRIKMRQDYKPKNRCNKTGKVRYRNEKDATMTLKLLQSYNHSGNEARQEKRVYICPKCNGWHLTSSKERNRNEMSKALKKFDYR